jgi:DNA helicase-2/ATP-dependent DNA helicase PcrA
MHTEQRIYGPPGTGKTATLTAMVAEAAADHGTDAIMVASYTTAAAEEVASRAPSIPEENIGTLHKFCYHAIGRIPVLEEKKKHIEEWNEFAPAYKMSLPGCKSIDAGLEYGSRDTLGDLLHAETTILRNKLVPRDQWAPNLLAFFELWTQFKHDQCGIDYTDMLEIALSDYPRAPGDPQVIFVDEAQDCTALQFAVLAKWAEHCEQLVMVGDDDQCIYQFAGSTPEAFAKELKGPNDRVLDQSHRLPFNVWEHAIKWIARVPDRVEKEYYPVSRSDPGFVKCAPFTWKQGEKIADLIMKTTAKYQSVMVLGACSYMLEPTRRALLASGIPFHNPYRRIRADWNPLRLSTGTTFAERVAGLFAKGFPGPAALKALGSVLRAESAFNRGMKNKLAEDVITKVDWNLLNKYFQPAAAWAILNRDVTWWNDNLVNDDARRKAAYPIKIIENFGPGFLTAEPACTLGTIHSIKGAETDVVIIFPDLSVEGMQEWTGKGRSAIRRLMYVGITRAREGIFVCSPASPFTCDL